jgi:hypothetical protein
LPATSNEVRVRVELSKNRLMIARPRNELRFCSATGFELLSSTSPTGQI